MMILLQFILLIKTNITNLLIFKLYFLFGVMEMSAKFQLVLVFCFLQILSKILTSKTILGGVLE